MTNGMADPSVHFAWIRTRLSIESTMMSWVRTAVTLIGFGFAIVQYFARLEDMPGVRPAEFPGGPRYMGLALIGSGIAALVISIWQYRWVVGYLRSDPFAAVAGVAGFKELSQSPVVAVAVLLTFIGLFAFFAVLLRLT